jgi:hypothetical protein
MRFAVLFLCLYSGLLSAQHSEQPLKESTSDLRNFSVLFSIEDIQAKRTFWLERTANLDHFLRMREKGEDQIQKISSKEAKELDMDFASRFLRCQYEIPSASGECQLKFKLLMKGEGQEICQKDDKKSQEILSFLSGLKKKF